VQSYKVVISQDINTVAVSNSNKASFGLTVFLFAILELCSHEDAD